MQRPGPPMGGMPPPGGPPRFGSPASTQRRPAPYSIPPQNQSMMPPQRQMPTSMAHKKRRLADKIIATEIRELIPEADAYMDLLSFEQKLDATLSRKKLDIQEALKRPMKLKRKLRIYVSHSFIPGKEPEKDGDEGTVPMWELRVEGRLIDDSTINPHGAGGGTPSSTPQSSLNRNFPKRKFSSFFKSLVIELDKEIYGPDNHLVEWHRTPQTNETDGFQVKRPGDRDVKCTILLLLDYQPMKFKLHPRLAKVLGLAMETRPKIIEALWQYIKTHKLQDSIERDHINCDSFLEQVFGVKRMKFMEIPQRLQALLQTPDPLVLNHIIKYNDTGEKATACYDIEVEMEDPIKQQMNTFLNNHSSMPDISALDKKTMIKESLVKTAFEMGEERKKNFNFIIYDIVEQLNEWKVRRDFYIRFSDNPTEFCKKWLISQSKDLKTMTETLTDHEQERRADYFYQPITQEGVFRYIYGKVQQKRLELEASLGVRNN